MATSPFPFGFSPAAANAQSHVYSPIPSHHHPLPPPFPSYHYAAAYPPPPPGFVPAPMYAPTPVFPPPPFCFEAPPYSPHPSPLPFFGAPHWPPPASELPLASNYPPTEAAAPPTSAPPANHSSSSQDLHASPGHPIHYPFPAAATFHYPPTESAAPPTAAPPTTGAPSLSATPETALLRYPDQVPSAPLTSSLCQGGSLTEGNGTGGASISNEKFVQGQAHHEQQQARAQTSFDAILGQLAKISSMLSRFAVSHGKQSSSAHTSKPEQLHHISVVPATPASSPLGVTTTAPIAPKAFDTMPTPSSGCSKMFGKQSSAAEGSSASSLSFPVDGMPQAYGLHNLICRTVVRADGTEHSYYALLENYPLERATPEPLFSKESVRVLASNPRQQPHEHTDFSESLEKLVSEQLPKCFNKPIFSHERPTVGTAGVFSLTNEQSVCDLEKLTGGENLSFAKQDKEQLLNCFSKASAFPNVLDVYVRRIGQEESQGDENLLREKYVCRSATRHSISIFPWDPGATEFPVLFMTSAGATELHGTNVFKSEFTGSCETQTPKLLNFLVNLKKIIPWPSRKLQLITPLKLFMKLLCANPAVQVTQQLHHLEFLVMAELSLNVNKIDGQLTCKHKVSCCLQIVLACPYSVPACYSSIFSSAEAIHSARSMSDATTGCVILVLSSDEIAEDGKDAAAVYKVSEIQLPMRKTSHIWDPGIKSILVFYKWLHIQIIQLVHCSAQLPPTPLTAYCPSNVEFVHQLGAKKYCNEKNLLSSPNYRQLLELDIIFITFLPP